MPAGAVEHQHRAPRRRAAGGRAGDEAKPVIAPVSAKPAFGTVAQATASAPAARRQSRQWQIPTPSGAAVIL